MVLPRWEVGKVDGSRLTAMKTASVVSLFCILSLLTGTQAVGQPSPQRTYPVVRLQPTAFPELPKNLVTELKRRGCTIPQVAGFSKRQNVIRGEFAKPGQTDWAALCYCRGFLGLYVFWNGSEVDVAVVGRRKFPEALPAPFETAIAPVSRKYILDHYRALGGPKPPPIDHQGIDWSSGMASDILYFYKGKWLTLQGAD
jgi:hypothetical protein